MYRANYDLGSIKPNFKVRFSLILKEDGEVENKKLLRKFTFDGCNYLTISPNPFVVIDISTKEDKKYGDFNNTRINFTEKHLFLFVSKLENLIEKYKTEKGLFYYDEEGKLSLNKEISYNIRVTHNTFSKSVLVHPCVVYDENNQDICYEGCIFAINDYTHTSLLTYDEMRYLAHKLKSIDMHALTLNVIQVALLEHKLEYDVQIKEPIEEKTEKEITDNKKILNLKEKKEIPEI